MGRSSNTRGSCCALLSPSAQTNYALARLKFIVILTSTPTPVSCSASLSHPSTYLSHHPHLRTSSNVFWHSRLQLHGPRRTGRPYCFHLDHLWRLSCYHQYAARLFPNFEPLQFYDAATDPMELNVVLAFLVGTVLSSRPCCTLTPGSSSRAQPDTMAAVPSDGEGEALR